MDIFTTAAAPAANLNVAPNPAFAKFEVGGTYWARSACNHDTLIRVTVAKRTAKTITTDEGKRLRVCTKYSGTRRLSLGGHTPCARWCRQTGRNDLAPPQSSSRPGRRWA